MKKRVSVIIPIYNEQKYINQCISSLTLQDIQLHEIVVINDESTDNTIDVLRNFNIKLINIHHSGLAHSRNIGLKYCSGEIVVILDGDIYFEKSFIKKLVSPIISKKGIASYWTNEYVANFGNIWAYCWNINMGSFSDSRITKFLNNNGSTLRAFLRSKYLKKMYDENVGYFSDVSLTSNIKAIPVVNTCCYHYNPDNLFEVYLSARWIGRSPSFSNSHINLLKYSIFNSIRVSLMTIKKGAPLFFIIFKIIFDFGIFSGVLFNNIKNNYAK
jgi:glycosyltransferase involved in cell wall biosynthesis